MYSKALKGAFSVLKLAVPLRSMTADWLTLTTPSQVSSPKVLTSTRFQKVAVAFAEMSEGRCLIGDEMGIGEDHLRHRLCGTAP